MTLSYKQCGADTPFVKVQWNADTVIMMILDTADGVKLVIQ
jgi:hypothetical protein